MVCKCGVLSLQELTAAEEEQVEEDKEKQLQVSPNPTPPQHSSNALVLESQFESQHAPLFHEHLSIGVLYFIKFSDKLGIGERDGCITRSGRNPASGRLKSLFADE